MGKRNAKVIARKQRGFPAPGPRPRRWISGALLGVAFFGLLGGGVEPHLIHHGGGVIQFFPTFRWGWDFLQEHVRGPGDGIHYLSAALSQMLAAPWAGAILLTFQALLLVLGAAAVLNALGGLAGLCWVPPLLLIALHAGYALSMTAANGLLVALAGAALFVPATRWRDPPRSGASRSVRATSAGSLEPPGRPLPPASAPAPTAGVVCRACDDPASSGPRWRLAAILAVAVLIHLLAGGAAIAFTLLVAALEWRQGRKPVALSLLPLAAVLWVTVDRAWFGMNLPEVGWAFLNVLGEATHARERVLIAALYLVLPTAALLILLRGYLRSRVAAQAAGRPASPAGLSAWMLEPVLPLVALLAIFYGSWNPRLKAVMAVDFYASQHRWPEVLQAARSHPTHPYIRSAVNRALYHLGRLGDELPLPQKPDTLLLPNDDRGAHWYQVDLYLDLGSVNLALHHATEAIAFYGEQPFLLRRLALMNLALGNPGTARIYLRTLANTPFQADWAQACLQQLEADPAFSADPDVARWRRQAPTRDDLIPLPAETMLLRLLEARSDNAMAGEYLVVHYMLSRNLQALARNLHRLDARGWKRLPPLYDEAAVLAAKRAGIAPSEFKPAPSAEALQRHDQFAAAALAAGWNPQASPELLPKQFQHSYYYYVFSLR